MDTFSKYEFVADHDVVFGQCWPDRIDVFGNVVAKYDENPDKLDRYYNEFMTILDERKVDGYLFHDYLEWYMANKNDASINLKHMEMLKMLRSSDQDLFNDECTRFGGHVVGHVAGHVVGHVDPIVPMTNKKKKKKNKKTVKKKWSDDLDHPNWIFPITWENNTISYYLSPKQVPNTQFTERHKTFIREFYSLTTTDLRHKRLREYHTMLNTTNSDVSDHKYFKPDMDDVQLKQMWYHKTLGIDVLGYKYIAPVDPLTMELDQISMCEFITICHDNHFYDICAGLRYNSMNKYRSIQSNVAYLSALYDMVVIVKNKDELLSTDANFNYNIVDRDSFEKALENLCIYFNKTAIECVSHIVSMTPLQFDQQLFVPIKTVLKGIDKLYSNQGKTRNALIALCVVFNQYGLVNYVRPHHARKQYVPKVVQADFTADTDDESDANNANNAKDSSPSSPSSSDEEEEEKESMISLEDLDIVNQTIAKENQQPITLAKRTINEIEPIVRHSPRLPKKRDIYTP